MIAKCRGGTIPRWIKKQGGGGITAIMNPRRRSGDWKPRTDFKNYIAQAMRGKVRKHDRR